MRARWVVGSGGPSVDLVWFDLIFWFGGMKRHLMKYIITGWKYTRYTEH